MPDNEANTELKEALRKLDEEFTKTRLCPSGDYSKLKFVITPNKRIYGQGDKVLIDFSAYNDSSDDININGLSAALFCVYKISFHDSKGKSVPLTSYGKKFKKMQTEVGMLFPMRSSLGYRRISPQESGQLLVTPLLLSLYYDLSKTGNYELTVECLTAIPGQKFDPPLKSNTIQFKVVDYHVSDIGETEVTAGDK